MKVSRLIEILQETTAPDDEVCVLLYRKQDFDYPEDDELTLTVGGWKKVCEEFAQWDDAGMDVGEWIADAVSESAVYEI